LPFSRRVRSGKSARYEDRSGAVSIACVIS
jgi:hypothetical protein